MRKRWLIAGVCLLLTLVLLSTGPGCAQSAQAPQLQLPKVVTMTCLQVGVSGYLEAAGLRGAVEQFSPMAMRLEPYDSDMGRMAPLRKGETQFALQTGLVAYWVTRGLETFKDWGPTPLRRVWKGKPYIGALMVRGNAGINSVADLKGKRIPQSQASIPWSMNNEAQLAFGGLTFKDVNLVAASGILAGIKGPLEGTVDAAHTAPWASPAQELAASRHGIKWLEMPPEDKAGWDRAHKVTPWAQPTKSTAAGLKKGETAWMLGYENGVYAYPTVPNEVVYAFVKAVKDGYDVMKKIHPDLENWTWDWAVSLEGNLDVPYHDGTVKFMKEMGVWDAAHEAFQQAQLKAESELAKKAK